jgi:hypothetical protein
VTGELKIKYRNMMYLISHISGFFSQDFGNMTHTHDIGNFSNVLLTIGEKCMPENLQ